jgi:hypothetical protein
MDLAGDRLVLFCYRYLSVVSVPSRRLYIDSLVRYIASYYDQLIALLMRIPLLFQMGVAESTELGWLPAIGRLEGRLPSVFARC